ncbi:hypothetical protein FSP39_025422 [Pinctada imbricata]|uniref:KxDL domain-containing protein n=1 Tax=Pinctada imbricata TaxID=66713 RepID=A0AA89BWJ9_PINIB|nr:hypothetical protein FSP39_025422 [Pinctada imbricata]
MSTTTEENDDIMEAEAASRNSEIFTEALSRYEKTNEMLINFNMLSLARYEATSKEFKQHTQVLYDMKKDLDNVFRRIRLLKQRLGSMYPEAFAACSDVYNILDEEEEDKDNAGELKESDKSSTKENNSELENSHVHNLNSEVASSVTKVTSPEISVNVEIHVDSDICDNVRHVESDQLDNMDKDDHLQNSDIHNNSQSTNLAGKGQSEH